jgi:hypothetical protein
MWLSQIASNFFNFHIINQILFDSLKLTDLEIQQIIINKGNSGVCLSDKQGRAGVVKLAFPGRYLLAAPHEFLDQSDGSVCL